MEKKLKFYKTKTYPDKIKQTYLTVYMLWERNLPLTREIPCFMNDILASVLQMTEFADFGLNLE